MIDNKSWGEVVVSPNPKKTSAVLDIDMKTGQLRSVTENKEDQEKNRYERIKEERGKKLGFSK